MWKTIQGVQQNCSAPGWFFCVQLAKDLRSRWKALRNNKTCSQAAGLYFMMQLEKIVSQAQQRPFHFNLNGAAEEETTKAHVLLNHGKDALGLDAAVHADQLALSRVDAFLHLGPLPGKAFGDIDDLIALCQRLLAAACPDTLLFQRATGTVFAAVNRSLHFKAAWRFVFLYTVKSDGLPISASVSIRPDVIGHILTAADVCAVFLRLLLLVGRGFHIQIL